MSESGPYSKQDVARSQINAAILLLSNSKNFVSANTLAWASNDLLRGVAKHRGIFTFQEELEERIKSEFVEEWRRLLRAAYTFSKHADRDPDALLEELQPEAVCYAILGSCFNYTRIFESKTIQMTVFQTWMFARNPEISGDEFKEAASHMSSKYEQEVGGSLHNALTFLDRMISDCLINESLVRNLLGDAWNSVLEPFSQS